MKELKDINIKTIDGRMLFCAVAMLSSEDSYKGKGPDEIVSMVSALVDETYEDNPLPLADMINFQLKGDLNKFEAAHYKAFVDMGVSHDAAMAILSSIWVFVNNQWSVPINVPRETTFQRQLESLINMHSLENQSNTPDFLLAEYLLGCLKLWTTITVKRDTWRGDNEVYQEAIPSDSVVEKAFNSDFGPAY